MSDLPKERGASSDRREFLQRVVGAGVAVAGTSLLAGCATVGVNSAHASPTERGEKWDLSWKNRLAHYRTAYDSPEVLEGAALQFADAAWAGYDDIGVPESEFTPILILRHTASVMVLDDEMWTRLPIGERVKLKDPATGETARRNPFFKWKEGEKHSLIGKRTGIDSLLARGAVVLACNRALGGVAYQLVEKEKDRGWTFETALAEVRKHVMPGCIVMPNGIFAVSAAQDAGANYMRVLV